jgi:RNA polymerase sigma factor (sigma-70 family)
MPASVTDTELARSASQGDRLALERLLVRHRPALLRMLQAEMGAALRASTTPEDLFQRCCLEAVRSIPAFDAKSEKSVFAWLATIARHRVLDAAKAPSLREMTVPRESRPGNFEPLGELFRQLSAGISTASHKLRRQELEDAVKQAVAGLEHPLQRQAVTLRYFDGLSLDEIARAMALSVDAVRAHLHRAREPLALVLAPLCESFSGS